MKLINFVMVTVVGATGLAAAVPASISDGT